MTEDRKEMPESGATRLALEVCDLRVSVAGSDVDIVKSVSLGLVPGEILGLVGESGSGKTTVGLALLAYCRKGLKISGGSVRIDGQEVLSLRAGALQQVRGRLVSLIPQDPGTALNPILRIGTQLAECFADPRSATEDRLLELLRLVKLPDSPAFLRAYPHQLSGGQQQRVGIAMAFANRPRVIVMDEPTTGLDVTTQSHVLDTIRGLCKEHAVAAIYVSHDLAVVGALCDRIAVMYSGQIVELGTTAQVLSSPAHPYTRALIEAVPDLDRDTAVTGIPGSAPEPSHRPPGCSFAPRCTYAEHRCAVAFPPVTEIRVGQTVHCVRANEIRAVPPSVRPAEHRSTEELSVALEVSDLGAFYGPTQILKGLSFSIRRGSCVALVGESGSGKTTTARCLAGLHRDQRGQVLFDGELVPPHASERSLHQRRRIQYIFQNPYASLNPRRTIGQSVAMALQQFEPTSSTEARRRVLAALDEVSLPSTSADRYPQQLSGGQRQRVAIARALIVGPELLICDEVTSALDVSVQAVVVELLTQLRHDRNLAMLFVTHNLAVAKNIAQDVAVMQSGRIVEFGKVEDVLHSPTADETQRLLADTPRFSFAVA
nr:ABC transporter ATP-binding protein [uncultured Devosia sp.]